MSTLAPAVAPVRERGTRNPTDGRRNGAMTAVVVILLALVSFVVLLPFVWMISTSLRTQGDLLSNPGTLWPANFTFSNYTDIWTEIPFGRQLVNTIVFAGAVTLLSVTIDSMAGYALARFDFKGKNVLFVVILTTLMLPIQVTLVPIFQLLNNLHWIDTYQGLIVPRAADAFGIFFMRQFFLSLPKDLEDAGRIDGASELRIWARIMMPLAWPAILTIGLFNLLANWNDLLWPLIVSTDTRMQTLPAGLALFKGQHVTQYGLLMAGAVLALLPMIVAFLFVQRRFIEGIATTGMK
jgi:multiple sugar transport system permease protein